MTKLSGTDYRSHGMIEMTSQIEKRISVLEANQLEDMDLHKQITDLKRCVYYLAEHIAEIKSISVSEVICDIGVLR